MMRTRSQHADAAGPAKKAHKKAANLALISGALSTSTLPKNPSTTLQDLREAPGGERIGLPTDDSPSSVSSDDGEMVGIYQLDAAANGAIAHLVRDPLDDLTHEQHVQTLVAGCAGIVQALPELHNLLCLVQANGQHLGLTANLAAVKHDIEQAWLVAQASTLATKATDEKTATDAMAAFALKQWEKDADAFNPKKFFRAARNVCVAERAAMAERTRVAQMSAVANAPAQPLQDVSGGHHALAPTSAREEIPTDLDWVMASLDAYWNYDRIRQFPVQQCLGVFHEYFPSPSRLYVIWQLAEHEVRAYAASEQLNLATAVDQAWQAWQALGAEQRAAWQQQYQGVVDGTLSPLSDMGKDRIHAALMAAVQQARRSNPIIVRPPPKPATPARMLSGVPGSFGQSGAELQSELLDRASVGIENMTINRGAGQDSLKLVAMKEESTDAQDGPNTVAPLNQPSMPFSSSTLTQPTPQVHTPPNNHRKFIVFGVKGQAKTTIRQVRDQCRAAFKRHGFQEVQKLGKRYLVELATEADALNAAGHSFKFGSQSITPRVYDVDQPRMFHCTAPQLPAHELIAIIAKLFNPRFCMRTNARCTMFWVNFERAVRVEGFKTRIMHEGNILVLGWKPSFDVACRRCQRTHPKEVGCNPLIVAQPPADVASRYSNVPPA